MQHYPTIKHWTNETIINLSSESKILFIIKHKSWCDLFIWSPLRMNEIDTTKVSDHYLQYNTKCLPSRGLFLRSYISIFHCGHLILDYFTNCIQLICLTKWLIGDSHTAKACEASENNAVGASDLEFMQFPAICLLPFVFST